MHSVMIKIVYTVLDILGLCGGVASILLGHIAI